MRLKMINTDTETLALSDIHEADSGHHHSYSVRLFLSYLLKEKEINQLIELHPHLTDLDLIEQVLEHFCFSYSARNIEKENIPDSGRVVIIANHPIASLDTLALIKLMIDIRRDIKILSDNNLTTIKPLQDIIAPITFSISRSEDALSCAQSHLNNEGALLIFPYYESSKIHSKKSRSSEWSSDFIEIASVTKSPILPVFIDGKNSPLFSTPSLFFKPLSIFLLAREMFKQRKKHLPVRVGEIIPFESHNYSSSIKHKAKLFRKHILRISRNKKGIFNTQKSIAPTENRQALASAIKQCELLGHTDDNKVIYLYTYQGNSSPILREIGRLREVAFRAVGEGSHQRRDLDAYDHYYFHLILWDMDDLEIIGAYRFGDAKQIITNKKELYTSSLFNYSPPMSAYLNQGLELGRSFVQPRYWGKRSLDYLWCGLGAFLQSRPQYRYVFGPVTLSGTLPETAKALLFCFYQTYFGSQESLAEAKIPYRPPVHIDNPFKGDEYKEDFIRLKSLLNNMNTTIPTLYKQYTELYENGGVRFLDFGVDPNFNYCIDGLVLADLTLMKEKKRQRYFKASKIH